MYIYILAIESSVGGWHVPKQFFHSAQEALDNAQQGDIILRMTLGKEGYDVLPYKSVYNFLHEEMRNYYVH